ncbi:MAG: hypothetical protein GX102_01805 [Porphyromonadaceae bacterium]|nr:hypothetical protein [Porphyromonadaceae bacterium]
MDRKRKHSTQSEKSNYKDEIPSGKGMFDRDCKQEIVDTLRYISDSYQRFLSTLPNGSE